MRTVSPAALLWARAVLRRHWRATITLALFAGVVGGASMTAWEYARRADTVIDRRVADVQDANGTLQTCPPGVDPVANAQLCFDAATAVRIYGDLSASSHQQAAAVLATAEVQITAADGQVLSSNVGAQLAGHGLISKSVYLHGRAIDDAATDEASVSETTAHILGIGVGDRLPVAACVSDFADGVKGCDDHTTVTIVGVTQGESDIVPGPKTPDGVPPTVPDFGLTVSTAWYEAHGTVSKDFVTTNFRLTPGSTLDDVRSDVTAKLPGWTVVVTPYANAGQFTALRRSTELEARALDVIALIILAAGLLFVGQTLVRQTRRELVERPILRFLGAGDGVTLQVAAIRFAGVAVGGAVISAAVAIGLSAAGPTGIAGSAEVDPGVRLDWPVVVVGASAVVAFTLGLALIASVFAGRTAPHPAGRAARTIWHGASLPPALAVGSRGFSRGLKIAVAGAALSVAAIATAGTLTATLHAVDTQPAKYGAEWQYNVNIDDPSEIDEHVAQVSADPNITDVALLTESGPYSLPGAQFWVISLHSVHGSIAPIIAAGRAPSADDEVALGRLTMRALGKHIGDSIDLPTLTSNGPVTEVGPYRIVGESVMASIDPAVGPGTGALVTDAGRLRIDPSDDPYLVVRASPKVPERTVVTDLAARFGTNVTVPRPQDDLRNIVQISSTPWTIAALLALLALASAAHALITSVRRRRRDFAILRSLGFTSGQVVQAVSWRAALIGVCAAVIGVPIGVLAGGWAWRLVARQIGLDAVAEMNTDAVWLAAVGALVATLGLSLGPGIIAGRRRLVDALRSE